MARIYGAIFIHLLNKYIFAKVAKGAFFICLLNKYTFAKVANGAFFFDPSIRFS
jgi:hypothetical protein